LGIGKLEAGEGKVQLRDVNQFPQQRGQLRLVPITLNFVQGNVEGFFLSSGRSTTTTSTCLTP
jgi:hypothetical protein